MNLRDHITKISDKVRIVKEYGILDGFIDTNLGALYNTRNQVIITT
jgi:hypothetical protein